MHNATLCLLLKEDKILLAIKKRGFGVGRWNGTGGKVKDGEDILNAALRETKEEIGVEIKNPEKFGLFHFKFPHKPEWDQDVHLFVSDSWIGEPQETEEMKPQWFNFSEIPYDKMWSDDILWLPRVLKGEKLEADFVFAEGDKIAKHTIKSLLS
jgi:8-oxo-dGTP pyrophosphatase MutT (NUDIX family)